MRDKEVNYTEKKQAYNSAKAGIDSDLSSVQGDAEEAIKEAAHEESQAADDESQASIERVKLQRAADEKNGSFHRQMPDGSEVTSYKQLYETKIKQQESLSKELRERQKRIKDNSGGNVQQVKMFRDLHKLLRLKVDAQQRAKAELKAEQEMENQDTNVFTMPED